MNKRCNALLCFYLLIIGFICISKSNSTTDENIEEKRFNLQKSFLNITKKSLVPFVNNIEVDSFPVSLDELKFFSSNVDAAEIYQINQIMLNFFYVCVETCNDPFSEQCHSDEALKLYHEFSVDIDKSDIPLTEKKSEHCKLLIAYFASSRIIKNKLSAMQG